MEITYFSPGQLTQPGPPLALYRPRVSAGALGPYLEAYTREGDLVIDLFCRGPTLMHEAARAGRRALGLNVNQATLSAARLGLTAVERQAVEAAVTQLAEARKGPETLQYHIEGLYRTRCATCGKPTLADAFIWEREQDAPVAKRYRCDACGDAAAAPGTRTAPTDEADRETAAAFERRGLSYWLMLDRAAARDAPHRDRVAPLLELYTPRNLSAVNDLLLKSDGLRLAPAVRDVLDALLLDTLDGATSLRSPDGPPARPRRLQRPARYAEANVWQLLERNLAVWRETTPTPEAQTPSLEALLAETAPETTTSESAAAIHLAALSSGQAGRGLPHGCAALILVDPPRPDTVLWHLSALWCHWLWGARAAGPLVPFLNHRWLDKDWLWRGLRGALRAVAPLLRPGGRLVCLFTDENPVILEAATLAGAGAGYELVGWGSRPPGEVRLTWRLDKRSGQPGKTVADTLSREVAERTADASLNTVRLRGVPVDWPVLHAAVYADLAASSLLAQVATLADAADSEAAPGRLAQPLSWLADTVRSALDGTPLRQLTNQPNDQPLWWLDKPLEQEAEPPLSDRVELAVAEILRDLLAVTETDLERRVCARFAGPQTPDAHLVRLCLFSYGDEHAPGHWRLRAEDNLEARVTETEAVITDLTALGQRLGFEVALGTPSAGEWAVRWMDVGSTGSPHVASASSAQAGSTGAPHVVYAFAVRTTAVLGDLLFDPPALPAPPQAGERVEPKTTPCLTLPGGRAVLVGHKLRQNPRLRQEVTRRGWQFLKFRHLRHLVQEVAAKQLDRYAFQAALGLDPIVEQEEAQLSLW